jgi:hypothetical protein
VTAAEKVIGDAFQAGESARPPKKTQFSRLVNLCGEASCAEEIENYLRYQAGRDTKPGRPKRGDEVWRVDFVNAVTAGVQGVLRSHEAASDLTDEQRDMWRVETWRLYSMYLARAYTYRAATTPRPRNPGARHAGQ